MPCLCSGEQCFRGRCSSKADTNAFLKVHILPVHFQRRSEGNKTVSRSSIVKSSLSMPSIHYSKPLSAIQNPVTPTCYLSLGLSWPWAHPETPQSYAQSQPAFAMAHVTHQVRVQAGGETRTTACCHMETAAVRLAA